MMRRQKVPAQFKAMRCYNFVVSQESLSGSKFINSDGTPYVIESKKHRILEISMRNGGFCSWIGVEYGLWQGDPVSRQVFDIMRGFCKEQGAKRAMRRFAYYDNETSTSYVSAYNGYCYKSTGGNGFELIPNGDEVVFVDDDGGLPCLAVQAPHGVLLDALINDLQYLPYTMGGMNPEHQRCLFAIWMFTLAFPDLFDDKPILLVEGAGGSGKTVSVQRIHTVVYGHDITQALTQSGEDDFSVHVMRNPCTLFDNTDTFIPWVRDSLCAYATGAGWTKRKLYTDSDVIRLKPMGFIALATKNPASFKRDDVADRMLIIRLERREGRGGFLPATMIFDKLRAQRQKLFGEWLYYVDQIVAALRMHPPYPPDVGQHRMASFAKFAYVAGPVLGFPSTLVAEMLAALQSERRALITENDVTVELIDKWLDTTSNQGREVRTADLHPELVEVAERMKVKYIQHNSRSLALHIRNMGAVLEKHFVVTVKEGSGGGPAVYSFRRKE